MVIVDASAIAKFVIVPTTRMRSMVDRRDQGVYARSRSQLTQEILNGNFGFRAQSTAFWFGLVAARIGDSIRC